jgi:hypothetical protein
MAHEPDDDRHARGERIPTAGTPVKLDTLHPDDEPVFRALDALRNDLLTGKTHRTLLAQELKKIIQPVAAARTSHGDWHTLREAGGAEWFKKAPDRRRWLLELPGLNDEGEQSTGVVPLSKVGMFAAAGAVGKTMALIQLAIAVATGREWLDTYTTPNPGHVLLALGEEDADEVRRRIYYAGKLMRLTDAQQELALDRIVILPLAGKRIAVTDDNGAESETFTWIKSRLHAAKHDWKLIALDPLSRFAGGDTEKDNAAATIFIEVIETLAEVAGQPAVILAHHITKLARSTEGDAKSVNAARGAGALTDGARWVANLEPLKNSKDRVQLAFSKSNYAPLPRPIVLMRQDGGALRAENAAERDARIKAEEAQAGDKVNRRRPSEPAGNGKSSTDDNILEADTDADAN